MGSLRAAIFWLLMPACLAASAGENRIPIVNENRIGDWWGIPAGSRLAPPAYPARYADDRAQVCMAVGYLLNADGTTSDLGVLKSWSAAEPRRGRDKYWQAFADEAAAALLQWRFVPKPGEQPRSVYTVATFLFAPSDADELARHCAIPSLVQHIVALGENDQVRLRMSGSDIFNRLDVSPSMELIRYSNKSGAQLRRMELTNQAALRAAQQRDQSQQQPQRGDAGGGKPKGG